MSSPNHQTRTRQTREASRRRIIDVTEELVRERSYAELNVGEIMERAGLGRTIFYRHFDDLADLVRTASRAAVQELFDAQVELAAARTDVGSEAVRESAAVVVDVYRRHGPVLRAVSEAAAADPEIATAYAEFRRRFDALVAETLAEVGSDAISEPLETARALNDMNEAYLLGAFGREPRISPELALETLSGIWSAVISSRSK